MNIISQNEATRLFQFTKATLIGMGEDRIIFGVVEKKPEKKLSAREIIPKSIAGIPTDVIETDVIKALDEKMGGGFLLQDNFAVHGASYHQVQP